jgi:hypothetical protein
MCWGTITPPASSAYADESPVKYPNDKAKDKAIIVLSTLFIQVTKNLLFINTPQNKKAAPAFTGAAN